MIKACWCRYNLKFRFLAKTSREEMRAKDTYYIKVYDSDNPEVEGIGECGLFKGLSADDVADYENILDDFCRHPLDNIPEMSSIRMGVETAFADLKNGGRRVIFPSDWQNGKSGIKINGLIWMGDRTTMLHRIKEKIDRGFRILKLKIGGIDFEEELLILKLIRDTYPADDLEIRLDANGSFNALNAMERLDRLSRYHIHSIEQPVAAGQSEIMNRICGLSPIPIALDEELIGFRNDHEMETLLNDINPHYIILKPTLCGGFERSDKWIEIAEKKNIGWWATSALESDIGLNAIAQWVSAKSPKMAQGLGTGELYENNITSPLYMERDELRYDVGSKWHIPQLQWQQ